MARNGEKEESMPLDPDSQIKRKILRLLQDRGGTWGHQEWRQIDSGPVRLDQHMAELVREGWVHDDEVGQHFGLTESGKKKLASMEESASETIN
jgi:hypothetical protein